MLQKSNETEVTVPLSGWSLRERPRTDSSCANFSLRVIRGCWSNAWCWVEVGMTFHVKNEETDHQRISLLIITRRNSVGTETQIWLWFLFCKRHWCIFFLGGGLLLWKMTAHSDCVVTSATRPLSWYIAVWTGLRSQSFGSTCLHNLTLFNVSQSF